jgi:hypothetical protein
VHLKFSEEEISLLNPIFGVLESVIEVSNFLIFFSALWEMWEPGTIPYPSMTNLEVTEKVLEGYRLPKPTACSDKIYQLMLDCWKENPDERLEFSEV